MCNIDEKRLFSSIIAYFIGGIASIIIVSLIAIIIGWSLPYEIRAIVLLPSIFIGSLLVGFIVRHKGWLLAAILTLIVAIAVFITPVVFGLSEYQPIIPFQVKWIIVVIVTSLIAGLLGEKLAQIWHKRKKEKR